MIRVTKRRANGVRRVNARIMCQEKIESICFVSCTIRNLCRFIENCNGLSFPTSRVCDIQGIGEPVRVVDVEITKNNDFRAWRL